MDFLRGLAAGTLTDSQIKSGVDEGWLIEGGFDEDRISQACYELCASDIYYELDRIDQERGPKRIVLGNGQYVLLKPKQLITIITRESLRLPENVLGRVLTKGRLFSAGVVPVNTYADPGFQGRLGIVVANLSFNYIRIEQGQPIAKIEFAKLRSPVERAYSGQHGYQTQMWPVPHEMFVSREELEKNRDDRLLSTVDEIELTHGKLFGALANRLYWVERRLLLVAALYFTFTFVLVGCLVYGGSQKVLSDFWAISIGLISNVVFFFAVNFATSLRR